MPQLPVTYAVVPVLSAAKETGILELMWGIVGVCPARPLLQPGQVHLHKFILMLRMSFSSTSSMLSFQEAMSIIYRKIVLSAIPKGDRCSREMTITSPQLSLDVVLASLPL
jgi:hypothetical protein